MRAVDHVGCHDMSKRIQGSLARREAAEALIFLEATLDSSIRRILVQSIANNTQTMGLMAFRFN